MIPGSRPDGIFTTGALQELINIEGQKPGNRAVILGSEHIAFSSVLTLKRKGIAIAGMVEEDQKLHTFSSVAAAMSRFYNFPVFRDASVRSIFGDSRVAGIEISGKNGKNPQRINCDTLILTGKFRPYSPLIDFTSVQIDSATRGPMIDMSLMTSVPNIYAAGNILRGADMHDLCALEGKMAAENILRGLEGTDYSKEEGYFLKAKPPIRYVVPQKILTDRIKTRLLPKLAPGCSIQLEHSIDKPVIEAWSSDRLIWRNSYRRLIANHRIPIPLWEFDLKHVDERAGITLKLQENR
jgi:hypothetical protein